MEAYKINGSKVLMPTGWHEVKFNDAVKIFEENLNEIEVISLLSGKTEIEIRNTTDELAILYFLQSFFFLTNIPQDIIGEMPLSIKFGDQRIIMPVITDRYDLGKASVGQVLDMKALYLKMAKEAPTDDEGNITEIGVIKICPYMVSIFLYPYIHGEYDGDKALEFTREVQEKMYFKDIIAMGTFFLNRLNASIIGQPKNALKYLLLKRKYRRAFLKFQKRLGLWLPWTH